MIAPSRIWPTLMCALAVAALSSGSNADQARFPKYNTNFRNAYWSELYPRGGFEFYCGVAFGAPDHGSTPKQMSLEHAYAAQWMVDAEGCGRNREECRRRSQRFGFMEADMHNLFPALQSVNSARGKRLFGEIPGEEWSFDDCDFEQSGDLAEPRKIARGNFARAIFYMHIEYNLPIDAGMLPTLLKWDDEDPVNAAERVRNDKIEQLQGTRNPFIDDKILVRRVFSEQFE